MRMVLDDPVEVTRINFGASELRFGPREIARDLIWPHGPIRQICDAHDVVSIPVVGIRSQTYMG